MDGILIDLLNAKWNTFVKSRFYRQFFLFCFYFVLSLISFTLRPGPTTSPSDGVTGVAQTTDSYESYRLTTRSPVSNQFTSSTAQTSTNHRIFQADLSEIVEKLVATSLNATSESFLNTTQSFLEKLKFDIISEVTSALKNVLPALQNAEDRVLESVTLGMIENVYRKNGTTDFPRITTDENSFEKTKPLSDTIPLLDASKDNDSYNNDDDNWYVALGPSSRISVSGNMDAFPRNN